VVLKDGVATMVKWVSETLSGPCIVKKKVVDMSETPIDNVVVTSIIHWFLIVIGMMQLLEIVKVQKALGQTVKLVEAVLVNISGFIMFFIFWVIIFSFLHRIIGRDVDLTDTRYPNVTEAARYFLHTWIGSTGGGATQAPVYDVWFDTMNSSREGGVAEGKATNKGLVMLYTVWIAHYMNDIYVSKILLSFLIAMIGKTFAGENRAANTNGYESRATLNAKCSIVMNAFGLLAHETDLVVVSANYRKPENPSSESFM
jgi:hypothetical protein